MSSVFGLGVDIGGTKTYFSAFDSDGKEMGHARIGSAAIFQPKISPAASLAGEIRRFCSETGLKLEQMKGITVGIPGVMDRATQVIASCPNLTALDGLPLKKLLEAELHLPVVVEKDVNIIALGEQAYGRGVGVNDLAYIIVGSGIGCSLITDGHLYIGADGAAGEFGHMTIVPDGRPCTCGSRGCLEMYCSGKALALQAGEIAKEDNLSKNEAPAQDADWSRAEIVIRSARQGNPHALAAVQQALHYLGLGISSLTNILNPRLVVLGGGIINGWPEGIQIVRDTVNATARVAVKDHLQIEPALLGSNASSLGAYLLIRNL